METRSDERDRISSRRTACFRPLPIKYLANGPLTDVCTIARCPGQYLEPDQWHQRGTDVLPDGVRDRFEIDPPTKVDLASRVT